MIGGFIDVYVFDTTADTDPHDLSYKVSNSSMEAYWQHWMRLNTDNVFLR